MAASGGARKTQRQAAEEMGFPLFGVAGGTFFRAAAGHGWGGAERRFTLRHMRSTAKVEVETVIGRDRPSRDFLAHTGVLKWASGRHPFPATLTVELRVRQVDVSIDGDDVPMWFLGDDDVWFIAGQVGDRHVEVAAAGLPLAELALTALTSLDGYEFPDERKQ